MTNGLVISGPADEQLRERIHEFLAALEGDPWGADPPERIAIASDRKQFDELMQTHLQQVDYRSWAAAQSMHKVRSSMAKACIAQDGLRTVIAVIPEETAGPEYSPTLLANVCHEICHTTMVGLDAGTAMAADTAARFMIWSEHIVERRREATFRRLGWTTSAIPYPVTHLAALIISLYQVHSRSLLLQPQEPRREVTMHWLTILNEFVSALGRAKAGAEEESEAVALFMKPMAADRQVLWDGVAAAADEAFASPTATVPELDAIAERAWLPLSAALFAEWDAGYAANAAARRLLAAQQRR